MNKGLIAAAVIVIIAIIAIVLYVSIRPIESAPYNTNNQSTTVQPSVSTVQSTTISNATVSNATYNSSSLPLMGETQVDNLIGYNSSSSLPLTYATISISNASLSNYLVDNYYNLSIYQNINTTVKTSFESLTAMQKAASLIDGMIMNYSYTHYYNIQDQVLEQGSEFVVKTQNAESLYNATLSKAKLYYAYNQQTDNWSIRADNGFNYAIYSGSNFGGGENFQLIGYKGQSFVIFYGNAVTGFSGTTLVAYLAADLGK